MKLCMPTAITNVKRFVALSFVWFHENTYGIISQGRSLIHVWMVFPKPTNQFGEETVRLQREVAHLNELSTYLVMFHI